MIRATRDILEMIKFSHTVFALPFALTAAFLATRAQGGPTWEMLGWIVLAMAAARSAAMAFNRLVDQRFDAANPRTAARHLPRGALSRFSVILFTTISSAVFLAVCWAFERRLGNPWPMYLGVPVLAFLLGYSLTKRFTFLSHFWLGASLMAAPIAAGIAVAGSPGDPGVRLETVLLGLAVLFWTSGFDIIYACQDEEFDRKTGLRSIPATLGTSAALWVARLCHVITVVCLVIVGRVADLHLLYFVGVTLAAALLVFEHSLVGDWRLRRPDLSRVNVAFFTVNGCVSLSLAALAILDIFVPLPLPAGF